MIAQNSLSIIFSVFNSIKREDNVYARTLSYEQCKLLVYRKTVLFSLRHAIVVRVCEMVGSKRARTGVVALGAVAILMTVSLYTAKVLPKSLSLSFKDRALRQLIADMHERLGQSRR